MPDWTKSMRQTFEYYIVDPNTWKDKSRLNNVISSSITRDSSAETKGSASINIAESVGECYVRIYLVTIQNEITEKFPLGTFMVQTPSSSFNGKIRNVTMDAYTPLIELKESQPPLGYFIAKNENIMKNAHLLTSSYTRAPVVQATKDTKLNTDFVADPEDTWMSYLSDLIANADFTYDLDELGRVIFIPKQNVTSMQPVWTYNDDNSSILYPDFEMEHDLYGIPNVVEVLYSNDKDNYFARVVNDNPDSPISTVSRGREIVYRDTNPNILGSPSTAMVKEYAETLLRDLSSIEYTITYKHGYCPTRVGDCVRLNYERAGIYDVKAKVISQTIDCRPGCSVSEKAVFTTNLWR